MKLPRSSRNDRLKLEVGLEGLLVVAPADEVDDLESVAVVDGDRGPGGAGSDVAVVLDGDAVSLELQGLEELIERHGSGEIECAGVAVELDGERHVQISA
jgi:hypothetical protein